MCSQAIRFFENGIVSHNLPIAEQVVGARATRSTHPKVLRSLSELMSLVIGRAIVIDNPLVWQTKGEVAALSIRPGKQSFWPTVSVAVPFTR